MSNKKTSFITFLAIIVICIIILLRTSYSQYSEEKILRSTNTELENSRIQGYKLDSISTGLQEAENNFRMYTSLWKKEYLFRYNQEIHHISILLAGFSRDELKKISYSISNDIIKKKKEALLYASIKKSTDSLMTVNLAIDTNEGTQPLANLKPHLIAVTRKIVSIAVSPEKKEPQKMRLFQRLKSAILNKESKKDTLKNKKVETTFEEDPGHTEFYTKKQLLEMEHFYKTLVEKQKENHQALSQQDQAMLKINERIFQNIKLMFSEFKQQERLMEENRKSILKHNIAHAVMVIDRSGRINFLINLLTVAITVLLLFKLYKAYSEILKTNQLVLDQTVIKSRFFTSISHEMRTPLNAILGATEQLKDTPLNDTQKGMTDLLESSSSMLLSAVNEILDFSRLETGKLSLSKKPFHYKDILNDIVITTRLLAAQKGLKIELHLKDQPELILMGDPYRLKQILVNLVANAIKFTDHGRVSIDASIQQTDKTNALLRIQVKDTGIGIALKDLPFIFNEFSQVISNKRTDWQNGSGLGLPICKRLVELHDGKISVSSIVSEGTTFNVELPYFITKELPDDINNHHHTAVKTDTFKNKRLLVVDDAKMNLLMIEMIFKKLHINFDSVTNGVDAIEAFEKNDYDMVLTDIEMPGMDGVQLTKKIRANLNDKKAQTPIIAITGHISPDSHQYYLSAGLNNYLVKPYKEKELLEKILDYLK